MVVTTVVAGNVRADRTTKQRTNHGTNLLVAFLVPHGVTNGTTNDRAEQRAGSRRTPFARIAHPLRTALFYGHLIVDGLIDRRDAHNAGAIVRRCAQRKAGHKECRQGKSGDGFRSQVQHVYSLVVQPRGPY